EGVVDAVVGKHVDGDRLALVGRRGVVVDVDSRLHDDVGDAGDESAIAVPDPHRAAVAAVRVRTGGVRAGPAVEGQAERGMRRDALDGVGQDVALGVGDAANGSVVAGILGDHERVRVRRRQHGSVVGAVHGDGDGPGAGRAAAVGDRDAVDLDQAFAVGQVGDVGFWGGEGPVHRAFAIARGAVADDRREGAGRGGARTGDRVGGRKQFDADAVAVVEVVVGEGDGAGCGQVGGAVV